MDRDGRHGHLISAVARWTSVGLALLSLPFVWNDPRVQPRATLAVAFGYCAFALAAQLAIRRLPPARVKAARRLHDVADALAIALGAGYSGGLQSPIWLLLYPHVVSVAVRAGLAYALAIGTLDAIIVSVLARLADEPLGNLHSLTLVFCAFMGGITSSSLQSVRRRLADANAELASANLQLSESLASHVASRNRQELALYRLQESEERYRRLLGRIQDGVVIIQDGRLVYANEVFARMVGDPDGGFLGREFLDLVVPEERPEIAERYRAWEESRGVSGSLETRIHTRHGETLLVVVRAGGVDLGKRSVIATVRDITLQRRMEQEVRDHAGRLAALNEIADAVNESLTIEDVFAVAADESRRLAPCDVITFALPAEGGLEVVAVGEGELRRAVLAPDAAGWVLEAPRLWARGGGEPPPHAAELLAEAQLGALATLPLRSKDRVIGSLNLGRRQARAFSGDDLRAIEPVARHIAIALGNARLLEQVVDANRRLSELDRLRREYLRNVSHEFRTPLTVIRGYAEFLLQSPSGAPEDVMRAILESCDRVIDLVDTLIEVSRIEQAEAERVLDVRRLDLREVAETSVEALRWLATRKKIDVQLDFAGGDFALEADGGLLQQVVRKLLDNALKYSPPGGRVCVRARPDRDDMRLEVEDSGIGIPPEHLPRIFEKFYVVDGGIARRAAGTGVGLYLVREIVRLHHGSVEVKSLPGEGSVFCVRLPRHFQPLPGRPA